METCENFHRLGMDFRAFGAFAWLGCSLLQLHHVAATCKITSVTPLDKVCQYKEGDTFRPQWFFIDRLLQFYEVLHLRKGSEGTLEAHADVDTLKEKNKAKREECGYFGEKCPPPAPVHSVHFVKMETDYKPTTADDYGMLMFTCNKVDEFPNACSASFNFTLEWSLVSDPGNYAQKGTVHYGMGLYAFSTYDAEAGVTRPVLQMRFSMGEVDGICGTEYKVNATDSCFGLKGKDVPVVDPPEPPSLNDLVKPPLPALHATPVPGMGAGGVIAIVLLVLVVLGGLGAGAFYMKRKKEEEQRALRTTQEVELN